MRYLVVGAGALGGYFGGRLLEVGCDVTFLVRPRRAEDLVRGGLTIRSHFGDLSLTVPPLVLTDAIASPYDVVIVACKAYDLANTMQSFEPAVGSATAIVPLLNGMRHLDELQVRFGSERVLGGFCRISATLDDTGTIHHLNNSHSLIFGELGGATTTARVESIHADFSKAKFEGRSSAHILQEMWEKWVFIASAAGITCLMRASFGEIVAAGAADLSLALLEECRGIAAANGFDPRPESIEQARSMLTMAGSPITASMLKDIERGTRVEADHVLGDLIVRAPLTLNRMSLLRIAYDHLKAYEAKRANSA